MARKSREAKLEAEQAAARLEEIKQLQILAENEEREILEGIAQQINSLCEFNGLFCGIILDTASLLSVVELAIKSGENVKIPFRLYFND